MDFVDVGFEEVRLLGKRPASVALRKAVFVRITVVYSEIGIC